MDKWKPLLCQALVNFVKVCHDLTRFDITKHTILTQNIQFSNNGYQDRRRMPNLHGNYFLGGRQRLHLRKQGEMLWNKDMPGVLAQRPEGDMPNL